LWPWGGGYVRKYAVDYPTNNEIAGEVYADEVTGYAFEVPLLKGLKDTVTGIIYQSGDSIVFYDGMVLEFWFNIDEEGNRLCDIQYGIGPEYDTGNNNWRNHHDVAVRKAWSVENQVYTNAEHPLINYSARDIQLFWHRVTAVGKFAFATAGPDGVGNFAHEQATNVGTVELPDTVIHVQEGAFAGAARMTSFIGMGVREIYFKAFNKVGVRDFIFGDSLEFIHHDWYTFRSYTNSMRIFMTGVPDNFRLRNMHGPGNGVLDNGNNVAQTANFIRLDASAGGAVTFYVPMGQSQGLYNTHTEFTPPETGGPNPNPVNTINTFPHFMRYGAVVNDTQVTFQARVRQAFVASFDLNGGTAPDGFRSVQFQDAGAESFEVNNTFNPNFGANTPFNNVRPTEDNNPNPAEVSLASLSLSWPGAPTRPGRTFGGWRNTVDGTVWNFADFFEARFLSANNTDDDGRVVFQAVFSIDAGAQLAITYRDVNGGAFSGVHGANAPTVHLYGTATTLVSPTRAGHIFEGWYTTRAATAGSAVTILGADAFTEDITLYAKWSVDNTPPPQPPSPGGCGSTVDAAFGSIMLTSLFAGAFALYFVTKRKKQEDRG
jgi:uncharacterized repeat protein (TIGR02543 family)